MKVLITGATGLIGKELVAQMHQSNIDVNYLTTSKSKLKSEKGYQGFYWDPKTKTIDNRCFEGVEVIVNLVGATVAKRWTSSYKKEILESRVASAALIYDSLQNIKHSVRQIVSSSAIGIYPDSFRNYSMEDSPERDKGFLGTVVTQWEDAALEFKKLDIDVCILRTGLVLSIDGGAFPKMLKPVEYGFGAFLGNGKQWQSWIHIQDISKMFLYAVQEELTGVFNAVAPNPVSNKRLIYTISKKLKTRIRMPSIPKFMMKLLLGEMHIILYSSQRVCSSRIATTGFEFEFDNISSAVENLVRSRNK